jgi:tRNA1Val (adenine37-N6)-methyltransferase
MAVAETDDELTDDALTSHYRVLQRKRGHRYSIDDVATAWAAARLRPGARRVADLGTGLGSVALSLAHALPDAAIVGIEAQAVSFGLFEKNVARNGLGARVRAVHGDLRDPHLLDRLGGQRFELVTGTPPYFPVGTATIPPDGQKAHARHELRGGVEDYVAAVARILAPGGVAVLCADARRPERVAASADAAALHLASVQRLVPREGKDGLFSLFVLVTQRVDELALSDLVLRDAAGARTKTEREIRGFFGLGGELADASPPMRARQAR